MALVPIQGAPQDDGWRRQMLMHQLIGGGLQGFAQAHQQNQQKQALVELLAGKQGPGLGALTQQGARGMDPSLAGPSLAMTGGQMAQPGMLSGSGVSRQQIEAAVLGGAGPELMKAAMARHFPEGGQGFSLSPGQVRYEADGRPIASAPAAAPDPTMLERNLIAAGYQPGTPEFQAKMNEAVFKPDTQINLGNDQAKLSDIGTFRNQYAGLCERFIKIRDAYGRVRGAAENPSPAGDLSLIFGYMKMLDPTCTVREGEQASAQNTTGAAGSLTNIYNRVITGERLTPEQRADFAKQAHNLFQSQLQSQQELQSQYRGIAQQTMPNYDPSHIVPDFAGSAVGWQPVAPPAATPNDPLAGAPVSSVYDIPGDLLRRGRGMVEQFVGGGQAQAEQTGAPVQIDTLPPVQQRRVGQVYQLPSGSRVRWAGEGWEQVD